MINKKRILIVDDVSSNIHLLMSILKQKYSIVAATNGEKALQLAKTSPMPDLILMDIVMPEMDGYEVCNRLKNDETTSHIPIIFITSLNSITEQEKSLKCGAADFITKPFSKDIVLHKVETHLNMQNLRNTFISDFMKIDKERSMNDEKQSILVVDDSPENIQVIIEVLKHDYTVSVATSAKKSLEMLENGLMPDLILLDVIMPEMDGYEFCKI
jgi:CheY-like chemotaxis protein